MNRLDEVVNLNGINDVVINEFTEDDSMIPEKEDIVNELNLNDDGDLGEFSSILQKNLH